MITSIVVALAFPTQAALLLTSRAASNAISQAIAFADVHNQPRLPRQALVSLWVLRKSCPPRKVYPGKDTTAASEIDKAEMANTSFDLEEPSGFTAL